ncbi:MAG: polysaccharide deacetylase [Magnetococcales bacterium]|nr:polysaccharide deacetylase [Magnetococcales bacterium]
MTNPPPNPILTRRQLLRTARSGALLALLPPFPASADERTPSCHLQADYRPLQRFGQLAGSPAAVRLLRGFTLNQEPHVLTLDPETLTTAIHPLETVTMLDAAPEDHPQSPHARALARQLAPPHPLVNAGLRRAERPLAGFCLTIDLCPAPKPMDYRLFEGLMTHDLPSPVPVAIAVSGGWIRRHEKDFHWLRARHDDGNLSITWINHAHTHFYAPERPYAENFLLAKGSDPTCEVLAVEWLLIRHGVTPPPFFRFPGLVSSPALLAEVSRLGLIAIGCDTILADGDRIRPGGIVLMHGNGNEPRGVELLLQRLKKPPTPQLVSLSEFF